MVVLLLGYFVPRWCHCHTTEQGRNTIDALQKQRRHRQDLCDIERTADEEQVVVVVRREHQGVGTSGRSVALASMVAYHLQQLWQPRRCCWSGDHRSELNVWKLETPSKRRQQRRCRWLGYQR